MGMPELRSGPRQGRLKSRNLDDIPTSSQPFEEAADCTPPAENRSGRRVGAGRGRGNGAAVARGRSIAQGRPAAGGRGRGVRVIDLDPEPCKVQNQTLVGGAQDPALNQAVGCPVDKAAVMEGGSVEKVVGAEEEATTSPIPDRVWFDTLHSLPDLSFRDLCLVFVKTRGIGFLGAIFCMI